MAQPAGARFRAPPLPSVAPHTADQGPLAREPERVDRAGFAAERGPIAGNVLLVPAPGPHPVQHECAECEDERAPIPAPASVVSYLRAARGRSLDASSRQLMEPRFGHDFSGVRVHTEPQAAASAQALAARAYTVGQDVVFGPGQYAPGTETGRDVLAHELRHVVEQARAGRVWLQRLPTEGGIQETPPRYSFSTNCGWIDWTHAQPGRVQQLIDRVRAASDRLAADPSATFEAVTGPRMESAPGGVLLSGATPTAFLYRRLNEEQILSVALRMFMEQSMTFERLQAWTDWIAKSSFSEEDLPSNLIAFYRAARKYSRRDIEAFCGVQRPADSLAALRAHTFTANVGFIPSQLVGRWPAELDDIRPADPHGPLMDMVSMLSETLLFAAHRTDLLGLDLIRDPALHIAPVNVSNTIDISSDVSGPEDAPTFEVRPLRPGHRLQFRWGLRDADDNAYRMWSEGGQVHQYGSQSRAYIGSRTRALLRDRGLRSVTVRCRVRSGRTERLLTFEARLTW